MDKYTLGEALKICIPFTSDFCQLYEFMKCIANRADDSTRLGNTFDSAHLIGYAATLGTCYLPLILKMEREDLSELYTV
jgi:hypothetical protein